MPPLSAVVLLGCACLAMSQATVGGWQKQDRVSQKLYMSLADYVVSRQTEGLQYYDVVVDLLEVQTQVVAGINYKVKVLVAPTDCEVGVHEYSRERCHPQKGAPTKVCVVQFKEGLPRSPDAGLSFTSYSCEAEKAHVQDMRHY
ncbi:cystatin-2-like [Ornithodoros turicata]|uniref:cystatin-2-like n=1 Tax=Ornithodoros turicata TaxID=34597 RepID=UPI00313A0D6D